MSASRDVALAAADITALMRKQRQIEGEIPRAKNDRRLLLLLIEEAADLVAELRARQTTVEAALGAATAGRSASLAYLNVGRTIAFPVGPTTAQRKEADHGPLHEGPAHDIPLGNPGRSHR